MYFSTVFGCNEEKHYIFITFKVYRYVYGILLGECRVVTDISQFNKSHGEELELVFTIIIGIASYNYTLYNMQFSLIISSCSLHSPVNTACNGYRVEVFKPT